MTKKDVIPAIMRKAGSKMKTARIDFENCQFDDAVSRAYYAVFHAISAILAHSGLVFSSHSQTIGAFNKEFVKRDIFPKDFSEKIQNLFSDRQISDYDPTISFSEDSAKVHLEHAEKIIETIKMYLNEKGAL